MKCLLKLSSLFFLYFLVSVSYAETKWEVGIVFLTKGPDVEQNLKEIQSIPKDANLSISVFTDNINNLPSFLDHAFSKSTSKKSLIFYSHGKGPIGLENIHTNELKNIIQGHTSHLDLLWFDACFMANIEFLYELKSISTYTIASEDAEFTSGLPFQSLENLPSSNSAADAALMLGKSFIESYSYIRNGSQKDSVSLSAATISIFENSKWDQLATNLKYISQKIKDISVNYNILKKYYTMENNELVDLGQLLIALRSTNKDSTIDKILTSTIRLLNIQSMQKLKTNARVKITVPETNSLLVFGFNNWTQGSESDFKTSDVFSKIVKQDNFIPGPLQNNWPYKKENSKHITLSPFAPGINEFDYYFLNADGTKLLTEAKSVKRTKDIVEVERANSDSPLLYSAYTQEIGKKAERYTGLSITMPGTIPSLDYFELEFNQNVSWLNL